MADSVFHVIIALRLFFSLHAEPGLETICKKQEKNNDRDTDSDKPLHPNHRFLCNLCNLYICIYIC